MSKYKVTLYGLYNFVEQSGDNLFKNLIIPEAVDKDALISNILDRGGEFEVLNLDPNYTIDRIKFWSKKWERTFEKWAAALAVKYEPLNNYDRFEEWTTTDEGSNTNSSTGTDTSHSEGSGTTDTKVSAYNNNNLVNDSQDGTENSADTNGTTTMNSSGTSNNTNVRTGRAYGNIGVTTSQQMLESELDIATWNIIEHITDVFLQEFTVMVYE